jgi:hypothetical protein
MKKVKSYKAGGVAATTSITVDPETATNLNGAYGSLRRAAKIAVELWPTVRDSFLHLKESFTETEWEEIKALVGRSNELNMGAINTLDRVLCDRFEKKVKSMAFLERVLIIDSAWADSVTKR